MDDKLIDIALESYSKAVVLKTYLEAHGIGCFLKNVNILQGAFSEGVKVQIRDMDAQKALTLLTRQRHSGEAQRRAVRLRRILVPVDFSAPSQNAARFAVMLAEKYSAEVKLLHIFNAPVVDMIPIADVVSIQVDFDISYSLLHRVAKEKLAKFHADLVEFAREIGTAAVPIGYALREGYAAHGIVEASQKYRPGIIVMGTKGEGYRSSELVGSVASEVSAETRVPLLVIPEKAVLRGVDEVKSVLYATNFDESDYASIRKLLRIVSPFNIKLFCVHVSDKPESPAVKAHSLALMDYFRQTSPELPVECSVVYGSDMVKAFMDEIRKKQVSLVALTATRQSAIYKLLNPSLSKRMIYRSDVPVLIFQA